MMIHSSYDLSLTYTFEEWRFKVEMLWMQSCAVGLYPTCMRDCTSLMKNFLF